MEEHEVVKGRASDTSASDWNRPPLARNALAALPLGSIRAAGWLREQLTLAARGLTGSLPEIWPDVGPTSGWLGGDGESWERGPYYLRGLVYLAHALGDRDLAARARPWLEWTLASQRDDGSFGPTSNADWWARMPMLEALRAHHEATGDPRVPAFLSRYLRHQHDALPERPLEAWAPPRGGDNIASALWLYDRTGEPFLLDLADRLHAQTSDWIGELGGGAEPSPAFEFAHGVNRAMGFRLPAVWLERTGDARLSGVLRRGWLATMAHHGQVHGLYSCDEFLHGTGPTQGTELCTIVELLSSFHQAQRATGEPWLADAIERIALNALPAAIAPDHCSHQYFQQVNQVQCTPGAHEFQIHHETDLLFGTATGYGCCAANMHIGWPQLAARLWYGTPDGGLAALQLLPCSVSAELPGGRLGFAVDTDFPFEDEVRFAARCVEPVEAPLWIRIPGWARSAAIELNGRAIDPSPPAPAAAGAGAPPAPEEVGAGVAPPGRLVRIARRWRDGDTVRLRLGAEVAVRRRGSARWVERGALVYTLPIGEEWRAVRGAAPFCDFEVHPRGPWAYGLDLAGVDPARPGPSFEVERAPLGRQPWARFGAPLRLRARVKPVAGWELVAGSAGPVPERPTAAGPAQDAVLVPYACARLRLTMLPAFS